MASNRITYNIGFTTDTSGLSKAKKALQEIQNMTTADVSGLNFSNARQELEDIQHSAKQLEGALDNAFNAKLGTVNLQRLNSELNKLDLNTISNNMSKLGARGQAAFRNIATQALTAKAEVKQTNVLLTKMKDTLGRTLSWSLSSSVINRFVGGIQQAIGYVKNLDTSLNNIRIVTGASADEMERFAEKANDAARNMGAATTDYTNAALIYYQQGLGDEEVEARTDVTVKTANVTQQSAEQVSEHLTAVWNGYKVNAEEAELYVDKLSAVAATTAADLGELSTGMSKVASAANTMGVDADQLNAQLATIISVTRQAPESVGTALKTIYARMGDLQVEGGTDEFGVSLGDVSGTLKEAGIEVLDVNGNLRDMGSVIEEVGSKWDTWTEAQKNAISIAIAGKRQYNNLFALFENWDIYTDTLNVSKNSMGALQEQQDIYMESTEAHLQQMRTAAEGLYDSMLDESAIITLADVGKELLVFFESWVDGLGGGLSILNSALPILLRVFSGEIAAGLQKFVSNLGVGARNARELAAQQEIIAKFGNSTASDALLQNLIRTKKQFMQFEDVMSQEEKERVNALIEQQNELQNQKVIYEEMLATSDKFTQSYTSGQKTKTSELLGDEVHNIQTMVNTIESIRASGGVGGKFFPIAAANEYDRAAVKVKDTQKELTNQLSQSNLTLETANQLYSQTRAGLKDQIQNLNVYIQALETEKAKFSEGSIEAEKLESSITELKNRKSELEGTLEKVIRTADKNTQEYKKQKETYEKLKNAVGQTNTRFEDFRAKQGQIAKASQSVTKALAKQYSGLIQNQAAFKPDDYNQLIKAYQKLQSTIASSGGNIFNEGVRQQLMSFNSTISQLLDTTEGEARQTLETIQKDIEKVLQDNESNLNNHAQNINNLFNQVQWRAIAKNIVNLVGSVGQLASAMSTLSRVNEIWDNEDLTKSEKILQTIQNLGFAIPMLVNSCISLAESLGALTGATTLYNLATNDSIKALYLQLVRTKGLTASFPAFVLGLATNTIALDAEGKELTQDSMAKLFNTGVTKSLTAAIWEQVEALIVQNAILLLATGAAIALGVGIYKWYKAEKEATEAAQQATDATEKLISANKELIETNKELLKSFSDYREVWKQWEDGTATVEELHSALEVLLEDLNMLKDPEIQSALRKATATGDYSEVNRLIEEKEQQIKQQNIELKNQNAEAEVDNLVAITKATGKKTKDFVLTGKLDIIAQAFGKENFREVQDLGILHQNIWDAGESRKYLDLGSLSETELKTLYTEGEDTLRASLLKYEKQIEEYDEKIKNTTSERMKKYYVDLKTEAQQNLAETQEVYDLLFGDTAALLNQYQVDATMERQAVDLFTFNADTSEEEIYNSLKKWADIYKTEYEKQTGEIISEEEAFSLAVEKAAEIAPDAESAIGNIQAYTSDTKEALNASILEFSKIRGIENPLELSEDDVVKIGDQFKQIGIEFNKLDFSKMSNKTWEVFIKEIQQNGFLTEETINKIAEETEITDEYINLLGTDFIALGDTMTIVGEKIEKGILPTKLASNKDYQSLIEDLTGLKDLFINDEEVLKAIDIISNPNVSGTKAFADAWALVEEKIKGVEIAAAKAEQTNLLEKFSEEVTVGDGPTKTKEVPYYLSLKTDEFYNQIEEIVGADYSIDIAIETSIDAGIEEVKEQTKELTDAAGKIGEGFTASVDDLEALNDVFPGILNGMKTLEDGSVQLNEAVVKNAQEAAKKEIETEVEKQIQELELQNRVLEYKTELNRKNLDIANKMANQEYRSEEELQGALNTLNANEQEKEKANKIAAAVAEGGILQDQIVNWNNYYDNLIDKTAAFSEKRLEILQAGSAAEIRDFEKEAKNLIADSTFDGQSLFNPKKYQIDSDSPNNMWEVNLQAEEDLGKKLQVLYEQAITQGEKTIQENKDLISILEQYRNTAITTLSNIGKTTSDTAESTKDLADSTKDAADAASKLVDILNEEIDAYHDINIAITQLETSLSRLQEQQAKLTGNELISNLNAQLDILEKQKAAYAEKLKIAQMEANVNRILLTKEGATFNDDGTINNYSDLLLAKQAYVNKIIEKYNKMSAEEQEGYEATLEAAKEEYEKVKEAIEKYDSLITEEIPGLQDSIQSAFNQQIEIQIEAFKLKVDLTLSTNEAEREWNTFVDKVINNISEEDTLGNALTKKLNLDTYYNMEREGSIQALTSQLNDTLYEISQIQTLGFSSVFGDNIAAAEEYAEELRKQLMTALEEEKALVDEIKTAYLEMIDQANEGLKEQTEQYEYISELIEHDKALIELLYGDKAYNKMSHYYTLQNENNKAQLAFYKQQADLWKERMDREEEGTEAWKKYKENWQESVSSMNDMLETSIQGIIDEYTNTINIIFEQLGDKVTGGTGLEGVKEEWELINDAAEDYLDDINAAYEIQKFQNTLQQAIDNTDSLDAQQTLTNLMNEQLSILEKKDKITQYDLDRANALYDVEVKRIALQEAQQNKSKMRLRRDSQGNYSYQFVSDEDQVAQAAQELAEAQNSLYNLDKDAYKNNLDQIQEIYSEWSEKLQEIISDTTLSYEEKQAEMVRLTQYYGDRLQNVAEQNASIRLNLEESVFQALADMYDTNVETFYNMSQEEKDILMSDMVPGWNDGIQEMIDKIMAEGGLASASTEAFEEIEKATEDFNDQLEELEDIAEISFDELSQGLDDCIEMNKDLLDSNEDLIDSWETQLSLIQDTIDSITLLTNVWNANKQAAIDAARAAWNYKKTQEIDIEGKGGSTGGGTSDNGGSSNGGNKGSNNGGGGGGNKGNSSTNSDNGGSSSGLNTKKDDWGEDKYPAIGDKVTYLGDTYYSSSDGARPLGNRGAGENKEVAVTYLNPGAEYPVHVESTDAAYGWLKKYQIAKMDTGGYTGDWNSVEGKVAVLHEKELVLNKNDTSNILQAVRSIRAFAENNNRTPNTQIGIRDIFESIQDNLFTKVATMMTSLEMGGLGADFEKALSQINDQTVHQDVHIDATFPNVQSSLEIENALMNLTNVASQYSFNTRR